MTGQYGVLVWRGNGGVAPTELNLPTSFTATNTTVLSDLGTSAGLPPYTARGQSADHPIAIAPQIGDSGVLHCALITNGSAAPSASLVAAAAKELADWSAATRWAAR